MKENKYFVEIEVIEKNKPKENEYLKVNDTENKKDDEVNVKSLIFSISITICITIGIFIHNEYINLIA
ncbi:hypothetical protein [Clostridium saccharoperbutylacetonicum]|uniref:hypothetical protein n=1 Tax=Clostridium saccharoperbutylacetonicum TaxID=36745 RepID=UPI0039E93581